MKTLISVEYFDFSLRGLRSSEIAHTEYNFLGFCNVIDLQYTAVPLKTEAAGLLFNILSIALTSNLLLR